MSTNRHFYIKGDRVITNYFGGEMTIITATVKHDGKYYWHSRLMRSGRKGFCTSTEALNAGAKQLGLRIS